MRRVSVVVFAGFLVFALTATAFADTAGSPGPNQLYGHITSNRTLTAAGPGPNYEIIGDLTIDPGVTLTVEQGVNVRAVGNSDYLASGSDPGRVELTIAGQLVGLGPGTIVLGSTQEGGVNTWSGVIVAQGASVVLSNCVIRDANFGVTVMPQATANLSGCSLLNNSTGIWVQGGGSAVIQQGTINGFDRGVGAFISPQGYLKAEGVTVVGVTTGLHYEQGASGDVKACVIRGAPSGVTGLHIPFSPSPADTLSPTPTRVHRFEYGVRLVGNSIKLDHFIISSCTYAVHDDFGPHIVNYCTFVDNSATIWGGGQGVLYNSILFNSGRFLPTHPVDYVDAWSPYGAYPWEGTARGNAVSSFDPFFVVGDPDYHLHPGSFYTNFSVSGGQIGAYGPGAVLPTPVLGATVVDARGVNGVVRIRWHAETQGTSKASVLRRAEGGDWEPLQVLYPDGLGYVALEDREVEAGARYEYGVGFQRGGLVGIDGQVWVTVEPRITGLAVASVQPNPASDAWSISFTSPEALDSRIEVVDLAGRVVRGIELGVVEPGNRVATLPARGLAPGVYWVRVVQGSRTALAKAVKAN